MDLGVLRAEADLDLPARAEVLRLEVVGDEALDLGRADEAAADPVELAADEGLGEGERAPAAELPLGGAVQGEDRGREAKALRDDRFPGQGDLPLPDRELDPPEASLDRLLQRLAAVAPALDRHAGAGRAGRKHE